MNKRTEIAVIAVIAALILTAGILAYIKDPEALDTLIKKYGYVGLFIVVLITNLSLIVGVPTPIYVGAAVALGLNPIVSTLIAAGASALGESTGYVIGLGGRKIIERRYRETFKEWRKLFKKYEFMTIVVIAALPFPPDDFAGLLAGSFGYEYWKFLLATFIGKMIKYGMTAAFTVVGIRVVDTVFYE